MSQEEGRPPTTVVHSSVPLGGFSSSLKQVRFADVNLPAVMQPCTGTLLSTI